MNINLLSPPAIHGEIQAGRSAAVRRVLLSLTGDIQRSLFDAAELLAEVKVNGYYQVWGFESLGDYAKKELNIRERKAQYLVRIVQICKAVGVKREHYELIGVTKLREITRLNPEDYYFNPATKINEPVSQHIVRLLSDAPEMTTEQVSEEVKVILGLTGDDEMVWIPAYPVKRSVREKIILVAREMARRLLGSAGRDKEGMATEYSTGSVEEVIHADFVVNYQDYNGEENRDARQEGGQTACNTGSGQEQT